MQRHQLTERRIVYTEMTIAATGECRPMKVIVLTKIDGYFSADVALVLYEYMVTFDREITAVWKRPWNATSILLLSVRWAMVLNQVLLWINPSHGYALDYCCIAFLTCVAD